MSVIDTIRPYVHFNNVYENKIVFGCRDLSDFTRNLQKVVLLDVLTTELGHFFQLQTFPIVGQGTGFSNVSG